MCNINDNRGLSDNNIDVVLVVAGAGALDAHAMQQAADYLVGPHDFQHFCKINFGNTTSHDREILFATVLPYPVKWQDNGDVLVLVIRGSGFLWHQVGVSYFLYLCGFVCLDTLPTMILGLQVPASVLQAP